MSQILNFFTKTKKPSFEVQIKPYLNLLFSMAYRYTGIHADAEDLDQMMEVILA